MPDCNHVFAQSHSIAPEEQANNPLVRLWWSEDRKLKVCREKVNLSRPTDNNWNLWGEQSWDLMKSVSSKTWLLFPSVSGHIIKDIIPYLAQILSKWVWRTKNFTRPAYANREVLHQSCKGSVLCCSHKIICSFGEAFVLLLVRSPPINQ